MPDGGTKLELDLAPEDVARLRRHLGQTGLPTTLPERGDAPWNAERLMEHFIRDKKVRDGKAVFVLARGIGKAFLSAEVPEDVLLAMLREERLAVRRQLDAYV